MPASARAALLQQRLRHLFASGALGPLLAALRDVNGDADPARGPRYAIGVDFQVIDVARGVRRARPIALFLPAFGGPGGEVDVGAQWFPIPRERGGEGGGGGA